MGSHADQGKKTGDGGVAAPPKGRVRRANFDDLDAIIGINDDIYEGVDYMPSAFYRFLHSKRHAVYVYEEDGQLIALGNALLRHEDNLVVLLSGRVRPSHQGQGHTKHDQSPLLAAILKDNPHLTKYHAGTLYKANIQRLTKDLQCKIVYIENFLFYKLQDRPRLERFLRQDLWRFYGPQPTSVSYSRGTEWLAKSDQLIRFLSKYSPEYVPIENTWTPIRVNKSELRYLFTVSNEVLVTFDLSATKNDLVTRSAIDEPGSGSSKQNTLHQELPVSDIKGFSYSTSEPSKIGLRADIHFFGDDETICVNHIVAHLLRYVRMTKADVGIGCLLFFPESIDCRKLEERVREGFGNRHESDFFSATKAIHYIGDFAMSMSKV